MRCMRCTHGHCANCIVYDTRTCIASFQMATHFKNDSGNSNNQFSITSSSFQRVQRIWSNTNSHPLSPSNSFITNKMQADGETSAEPRTRIRISSLDSDKNVPLVVFSRTNIPMNAVMRYIAKKWGIAAISQQLFTAADGEIQKGHVFSPADSGGIVDVTVVCLPVQIWKSVWDGQNTRISVEESGYVKTVVFGNFDDVYSFINLWTRDGHQHMEMMHDPDNDA
jgi:hypothetical protein